MSKTQKILQQTKIGYNQIAEHFSATRYAPWSEFSLFLEYIKAGQKILDLGCGNGRLLDFFVQQGLAVDYYGLDVSENLIQIAEAKNTPRPGSGREEQRTKSYRFQVGDMAKLPYPDDYFDTVISIAAFHHLPNKELRLKSLKEIYQVLKPGGYLLMTNWHLWHQPYFKHFFNQFFQKISLKKDFFVPWKSDGSPRFAGEAGQVQCQRYYHAFTKGELKKLLHQTGFKTEKVFLTTDPHHQVYGRGVNIVSVASK